MIHYRLKLVGLSEADSNSVKSMLRLSKDLLTADWQCVGTDEADLFLYALDSDVGRAAWATRDKNLAAIITQHVKVDEPVDIILQKPLRRSSFAEALNLATQKIQVLADYESKQYIAVDPVNKSGSWLSKLFHKAVPERSLPNLTLDEPDNSGLPRDTIKDKNLLKSWAAQLPDDANQRIGTLLSNLSKLNKIQLKAQQHFDLLEIYRDCIKAILFKRDMAAVRRDLYVTTEHLKAINNISELLAESTHGYKKILAQFYLKGDSPKHQSLMHLSLLRAAEQVALSILHEFHYYRRVPASLWHQLHEFYLYLEAAEMLHDPITIKDETISPDFYTLYLQIILTALADPYSLGKFEVQRLYSLVLTFIDKTELTWLSKKEITSDSSFMLTGLYSIDCDNGTHPIPMEKTSHPTREAANTRMLNIQTLIFELAKQRKRLANKPEESLDLEQKLLLKIIPQLNTSQERRYHRIQAPQTRRFSLAIGIKAIHENLYENKSSGSEWKMINQSSGGFMAQRQTAECPAINIGDFVGIFESDFTAKLAIVRWLQIDPHSDTFIGFEYIEQSPTPVFCMPDGEPQQYPGLLLKNDEPNEAPLIYAAKGLYSPKRQIRIKDKNNEPYQIIAGKLFFSTLDYELFNYRPVKGS